MFRKRKTKKSSHIWEDFFVKVFNSNYSEITTRLVATDLPSLNE